MEWIIDNLNTRELAITLWTVIIFILFIFLAKQSIFDLIKIAFCKQCICLYTLIIAYSTLIIYALYSVGFWDLSLLKDSILIIISIGLASCFKIATNKNKTNFLKELILGAISLIVIIQFVTNMYTFNFLWELITLPVLAFIIILKTVTEREKRHTKVVILCDTLLIIYGLTLIVFSIIQAMHDYHNFLTFNIFKNFLLPIIMLLLYLPLIYYFAIHCLFQEIFVRLQFVMKDKKLIRYFKFKIITNYCFRLQELEKFKISDIFAREPSSSIENSDIFSRDVFSSKQDIDSFFNDIKKSWS